MHFLHDLLEVSRLVRLDRHGPQGRVAFERQLLMSRGGLGSHIGDPRGSSDDMSSVALSPLPIVLSVESQ